MSGIEIAAGVAGLVTAFVGVGNFFMDFADRRRAKKIALKAQDEKAETRLTTTLQHSPNKINGDYQNGVRSFGERFARGDGIFLFLLMLTVAIAQKDLLSVSMQMNHSLMNVVQGMATSGNFAFRASEYDGWNNAGTKITNDTVRLLSQLYQRTAQAAPIPHALNANRSRGNNVNNRNIGNHRQVQKLGNYPNQQNLQVSRVQPAFMPSSNNRGRNNNSNDVRGDEDYYQIENGYSTPSKTVEPFPPSSRGRSGLDTRNNYHSGGGFVNHVNQTYYVDCSDDDSDDLYGEDSSDEEEAGFKNGNRYKYGQQQGRQGYY